MVVVFDSAAARMIIFGQATYFPLWQVLAEADSGHIKIVVRVLRSAFITYSYRLQLCLVLLLCILVSLLLFID